MRLPRARQDDPAAALCSQEQHNVIHACASAMSAFERRAASAESGAEYALKQVQLKALSRVERQEAIDEARPAPTHIR